MPVSGAGTEEKITLSDYCKIKNLWALQQLFQLHQQNTTKINHKLYYVLRNHKRSTKCETHKTDETNLLIRKMKPDLPAVEQKHQQESLLVKSVNNF